MKYRALYLTIFLHLIWCVGCDEYVWVEGEELIPSLTAHYLRPSQTSFRHYTYTAFDNTFDVESYNTAWMFSEIPDWISLNPNSGDESKSVMLSVNKNPYTESRSAIFYLSSTQSDWEYSCAMSVSQSAANAELAIDKKSLQFGGGAESQTIVVTSNCEWSVSNSESWIATHCDNENNILTISVMPNSGPSYRSGSIVVKNKAKSLSISVIQAPAEITSSAISLKCENVASAYTIAITSEADWSASVSDSWINVSPNNGMAGTSNVTIEVAPNTNVDGRSGFVTFYTGRDSKLQIEIVQSGLYIETDEELAFSVEGDSKPLYIHSNTDWQILNAPNWLNFSKTKGSGNCQISIAAYENLNSTIREGEIIIGQSGLDIRAVVKVWQDRKKLSTDRTLLSFSDKSGTLSFNIFSNADWTSSFSDVWFNATPSSGHGDCVVEVSVAENNSATERTGTIQYNYADNSTHVNVRQLAKYLTIDNDVFNFSSTGGSHTIEICTNDGWTAELEHPVSWLSLSVLSGDGDTNLIITAADNPSVNVRSTAIIIKSKHSQDVRILVSQKPRTLTLSTQKLLFFADGGMSDIITIKTDGKYDISSEAAWFTLNKYENNSFAVYAAKNNSDAYREGIIKISLTDLVDCSLSVDLKVIQVGRGGSFVLKGFEEEQNWDSGSSRDLKVDVVGYQSDKNWDDVSKGNLVVNISGFTTEYDWNLNDKSNGRATITHYGEDKDWDKNDQTSNQITGQGYTNDENWNDEYK